MTYIYTIRKLSSGTWTGYYITLYAKKGTPVWMSDGFIRRLLWPLSPFMFGFYWKVINGFDGFHGFDSRYASNRVSAEYACVIHAAKTLVGLKEKGQLYNPYERLSNLTSDQIEGLTRFDGLTR